MKKYISLFALIALFGFAGCDVESKSTDEIQADVTEQLVAEAQRQVGMPAITNWQERKLAKMIFELRDREDLITYTYIVNLEGELIFLGKSLGYGLPYSVQFTNPERKEAGSYISQGIIALPQPDPNGLFMPEGLSATWVMLFDPETDEVRPVYVEPEIMVSPFPLHATKVTE